MCLDFFGAAELIATPPESLKSKGKPAATRALDIG